MRIYLASSWRNNHYYKMLDRLTTLGYEVYDFRNANSKFSWKQVDSLTAMTNIKSYLEHINDERCEKAYANDITALDGCDVCVMLMPCGNSAHMEAGRASATKPLCVFLGDDDSLRPDLMWKMGDLITDNQDKLESWLKFQETRI